MGFNIILASYPGSWLAAHREPGYEANTIPAVELFKISAVASWHLFITHSESPDTLPLEDEPPPLSPHMYSWSEIDELPARAPASDHLVISASIRIYQSISCVYQNHFPLFQPYFLSLSPLSLLSSCALEHLQLNKQLWEAQSMSNQWLQCCMHWLLRIYGYMFVNMKICMSQTCLYNISTKKLPDLYNNESLQKEFGYSSATLTLLQYTVEWQ